MSRVITAFFAAASLTLMLLGAVLIVYAVAAIVGDLRDGEAAGAAIVNRLSYVILALAVFDVAKYLFEEEVRRGREMRQAAETRRSLTKFVTTILIAILLEGLVTTSKASEDALQQLLYPSALILSGVALLVGLAVFQRLSATVEEKVGGDDRRDEAEGAPR